MSNMLRPTWYLHVGRRLSGRREPRLIGFVYLLPAAALYSAFVLYPASQGLWISLFKWDGVTPATWVGMANYVRLASDEKFLQSITHSIILLFFNAVLPLAIGLALAALVARASGRGSSAFRAIFFLPQVIPVVAVGIAWRWVYSADGPLNDLFGAVGLGKNASGWLGDFTYALPAVGLIGTWVGLGFCLVLFLAGIQNIPRELYDAARVDGAGRWAEFRAVTMPGVRNEFAVAAVVTTIGALRSFDVVYVTTAGGPGHLHDVTRMGGLQPRVQIR